MNTNENIASRYGKIVEWGVMILVIIGMVFLWVNWRNGSYPFSNMQTRTGTVESSSMSQTEKTLRDVLGSLSATSSPVATASTSVVKSLTPSLKKGTPIHTDSSLLDSLTVKK